MVKKILFLLLFISLTPFLRSQTCQQTKTHRTNSKAFSINPVSQAANSRSDTVDILNYTINLDVTDFTNHTIKGNTQVKFTPKVNNVNQLKLDLLQLVIDSIQINGSSLTYNYNDTLLQINLPTTSNTTDTISATVFYHGSPQGDPSGWGGFYFDNSYAFNLGVGFGANPHPYGRVWFPCFDNFVERSSYEFNITTSGSKVAYCNGYLANDTTDNNGLRTRKWIINEQIPSYLASMTVGDYTQVNQTYNGINGPTPIILTALASDTNNVKGSFVNLNAALSTFENYFGPYMWNRVGYCMVPFNDGAMEHATNISYPKVTADGTTNYQTLYAHELSHHWFGDLATCRTQEDMWLNEGWARYCEFLFTESLSGHSAYLYEVRTNHEDNLHFNTPKEGNLTLANIPFEYTYGDHVYNKGADIAHTLREYLGDSLFFNSVKTYLSQNHFKDVSSADFRDALTNASGIDMTNFFNDWVFNPGWPHFSIDSFTVAPNGQNYNVTVYVKQKLTGAPNYYTNVPLEVTFKAADWTENTQTVSMSGATSSFNLTVPFLPVFTALNMGEKISHAIAPEYKTLKTIGNNSFANAKMNIGVLSITDSAFIRIEHNYTAPDPFKRCCPEYRLSPNRYWKIDGILPSNFRGKASFTYDGRNASLSGFQWLDNELITTTEDSLVLMYRKNAADDWNLYPYYTKNIANNATDKHGVITIDTLKLGEYTLAMKDYTMSIFNKDVTTKNGIKVFPNPTKDLITIDFDNTTFKSIQKATLIITDASGKVVYNSIISPQQNSISIKTDAFNSGMYCISITANELLIAKSKFIVAH